MSIKQGNNYIAAGGGTGAWGSITGTLSDQTDLNTALENKANDVDVVKLAGIQTITGNKTFTGVTTIYKPFISPEVPTTNEGGEIVFLGGATEPNSSKVMQIDRNSGKFRFFGKDSSDNIRVPLQVDVENNAVIGVTPATSDNSTKIATTAFVKAQGYSSISSIFPVGSCYITIGNTNPNTILGVGTWTLVTSSVITSVNTNVPVKGDGKTLGLTNGNNNFGVNNGSSGGFFGYPLNFDVNVGTARSGTAVNTNASIGITTDATKSGIVGTVTRTATTIYIWQRTA